MRETDWRKGANSGIGRATAAQLALRGARVILACRNKQRGEAAAQAIRKETENDAVIFMHLDLASQKSIRSFAETFLKTEPRLDLLVNNAGLATTGRNEDGLGMILAVNHIGPFLLTNLLLERLKECAPSRVINVSSLVHHVGTIDFDCINTHKTLNLGSSDYDVFWDYSSSKLCNVLFTHELAKRLEGTNVTCYSVYPGSVKTELNRDINEWFTCILKFIIGTFLVTDAVSGAQTTLYCALQENIEHLSGKYFSDSQVMQVKPEARDDGIAKKLIFVHRKTFTGTAKLHGKTVIVTGGNTGIGKATAAQLAIRGARVILACRSKQRGEEAAREIRMETGSDAVFFMQLDLSSQKSIRSFAETFLKAEPRLDLLINNAALAAPGRTEDGLGMILGVNHIGPFLLTNLLLERLKECAPSRVINVSSCGHDLGTIDFDCINTHKKLTLGSSDADLFRAYTHSKLCNVLFTHELAKRLEGTNVTCYSLHPG
ncbi:dehydrogenase reductase SDR family member 13-like protein [Labeo rohita]|uniref:Dehydrogenase reductase SDR family member 13-like protein n=1 Tax=Labeo rohita TaxID=84645 RepID=A0A498NBK9_LABRO|nr:dehydrogenase reductase SDR family member 13-like protein [Labeo rohita]